METKRARSARSRSIFSRSETRRRRPATSQLQTEALIFLIRPPPAARQADVCVTWWSGIDQGRGGVVEGRGGGGAVVQRTVSAQELINNIKAKTWRKVDEMKISL